MFSGGVKLEERNVQLLLFADDLMLVSEEDDVERNLSILEDVMAKWKIKIKRGKIKTMIVNRGGGA